MTNGEPRTETRRTFIPGKGHLVEHVPAGTPAAPGTVAVKTFPEPAQPVTVVSVENVPLLVALQVVEANGMVAVPRTFLTEEQLAELEAGNREPAAGAAETATAKTQGGGAWPDVATMKAADAITRVQAAASFEELNGLMRNEKRATVIKAAETRAEDLKGKKAEGGDPA